MALTNTYKGILSSDTSEINSRQSHQDKMLLTIDDAITSIKSGQAIQSMRNKGIAHDALHNIHDELKSYWIQFGFLTVSTRKNFLDWACNNMTFKEYKQTVQSHQSQDDL